MHALHPDLLRPLSPQGAWPKALGRLLRLAALAACAGPAGATGDAWPETYVLRPLVHQAVVDEMQRCVGPQVGSEQLQGFVARALDAQADELAHPTQLADMHGQAVVLVAAGRWACVPLSDEGFPRWPLEALHGLIVPLGVPADVTKAWRRKLLAQVSRDGVGRGLIVYPNGDADQVHVIAEQRQALQVKFSTRLLPAGSYSEQQFSAVLRHPRLSGLVTRSSAAGPATPSRMAIPPHRLLRPVRDGFVVVEPTPLTQGFSFAGTQWDAPSVRGSLAITLDAQGRVLAAADASAGEHPDAAHAGTSVRPASARGTVPRGRWQVNDGVLQLTLDTGECFALTLREDPYTLSGVVRRAEATQGTESTDDEGAESQWPAQLRRLGARPPGASNHLQQVQWKPWRPQPVRAALQAPASAL